MNNPFQKASRSQVYLKDAITGPTGSGKTFSALRLAFGLVDGTGKRVAFLDTENDSASLYSDKFDFDVMAIAPPFAPESFRDGINAAVAAGYGAVIIDSASHFWKGILAFKDQLDSHGKGNSYTNWKQADGKFDPVIEAVLQSKIHVIFCMRSKMDYLQTEENGKKVIKKMGLAPIMRDGLEYEFSTVFDIGMDHTAMASKDRTGLFPTDKVFQITEDTGRQIAQWLNTATAKPEPEPATNASALLSDDERKAANIAKLRKFIGDHCSEAEREDYEAHFCQKAATLCEDPRDRARLDDFTLDELRAIFPKHKLVMKMATDAIAAIAKP
jgi:hypothetical protein